MARATLLVACLLAAVAVSSAASCESSNLGPTAVSGYVSYVLMAGFSRNAAVVAVAAAVGCRACSMLTVAAGGGGGTEATASACGHRTPHPPVSSPRTTTTAVGAKPPWLVAVQRCWGGSSCSHPLVLPFSRAAIRLTYRCVHRLRRQRPAWRCLCVHVQRQHDAVRTLRAPCRVPCLPGRTLTCRHAHTALTRVPRTLPPAPETLRTL